MLDLSSIYKEIQYLKLQKYNSPFPTIFLSAKDPDDACYLAIKNLIQIILKQDSTVQMRILCRRLKRISKIDKIYILS
jgi:hypothetical protein